MLIYFVTLNLRLLCLSTPLVDFIDPRTLSLLPAYFTTYSVYTPFEPIHHNVLLRSFQTFLVASSILPLFDEIQLKELTAVWFPLDKSNRSNHPLKVSPVPPLVTGISHKTESIIQIAHELPFNLHPLVRNKDP